MPLNIYSKSATLNHETPGLLNPKIYTPSPSCCGTSWQLSWMAPGWTTWARRGHTRGKGMMF